MPSKWPLMASASKWPLMVSAGKWQLMASASNWPLMASAVIAVRFLARLHGIHIRW